jgi:hypothetical protein
VNRLRLAGDESLSPPKEQMTSAVASNWLRTNKQARSLDGNTAATPTLEFHARKHLGVLEASPLAKRESRQALEK